MHVNGCFAGSHGFGRIETSASLTMPCSIKHLTTALPRGGNLLQQIRFDLSPTASTNEVRSIFDAAAPFVVRGLWIRAQRPSAPGPWAIRTGFRNDAIRSRSLLDPIL